MTGLAPGCAWRRGLVTAFCRQPEVPLPDACQSEFDILREVTPIMTPAVLAARRAGIRFQVHEYPHDPRRPSYGIEAAEALGVDPARVFKTLVVTVNEDRRALAVGVVPVSGQLDLNAMAAALGVKKVGMADPQDAERATGYVVGGISPLGQKKRLLTVLDVSAADFATLYVSGGRRGLEIELSPEDLTRLTSARSAPIANLR